MAVRGGLQEEVTGADLWTVNRQSMKGGPQEGLVNAIRLAIQEVHRGSAGGRMEERGGWRQGGHPAEALNLGEGMSRGVDFERYKEVASIGLGDQRNRDSGRGRVGMTLGFL